MSNRAPERWEGWIVGGCICTVSAVLAVCLSVFLIGAMFFGLAYMAAHWP